MIIQKLADCIPVHSMKSSDDHIPAHAWCSPFVSTELSDGTRLLYIYVFYQSLMLCDVLHAIVAHTSVKIKKTQKSVDDKDKKVRHVELLGRSEAASKKRHGTPGTGDSMLHVEAFSQRLLQGVAI